MHTHSLILTFAAIALDAWPERAAAPVVEKQAHGVLVHFETAALRMEVLADRVVRIDSVASMAGRERTSETSRPKDRLASGASTQCPIEGFFAALKLANLKR